MIWWLFKRDAKKMSPAEQEKTLCESKPDCPYCPDAPPFTMDRDTYLDAFDKIQNLLDQEKYKSALTRIEALLPHVDPIDHTDIASHIVECFESLTEGKAPQAVLNAYDKLHNEGQAISFAEIHGERKNLSFVLVDSLKCYPEVKTKVALKKATVLVMQDHPLMHIARTEHERELIYFLDDAADEVFAEWKNGERDDLAGILANIEAAYAGNPQQGQTVNATELTCSCREWATQRATFAPDHPSRLCIHLERFVINNPKTVPDQLVPYTPFFQYFAETNQGMPFSDERKQVEYGTLEGEPYIITMDKGTSWVNVRLPKSPKYGFSIKEKRWAKNSVPKHAAELANLCMAFAKVDHWANHL